MKLLTRILVATDFSPAADDAVEMAVYTARQFESSVYLLHVRQEQDTAGSSSDPGQAISERLDAIAQRMVEQGVQHVESVVLDGAEADEISSYAEQEDVNLIVIGAGEMAPGGHQVFLGNTAARLRRWSSKPVWIVKPGMSPPIRRILCPVDLSPASSRALKNAIHFARAFDAQLAVLLVTKFAPKDDESRELWGADADAAPESREPHLPAFDQFLAKFDFDKVRSEKLIRQGKPRDEVVLAAQEIAPDLIVMGSAGRRGMSRMLIGGVARRVAQVLPCSVITVREKMPIQLTLDREVPPLDAEFCATHPSGRHCERYEHGLELLEQGLAEEAARHFLTCVLEYSLCANAWRRLADANVRVGRPEEARRCEQNAQEAVRRQENLRIEDDVRGSHILHRRMFGI